MKKKSSMSKPLFFATKRPDLFGSRVFYAIVMYALLVFVLKMAHCAWPWLVEVNASVARQSAMLHGIVVVTIAGFILGYATSLAIGIFGMFWRPGDKDGDPGTVDHSVEVPPSGASAHGLREKGYIFPDIMNPFTFFYLYKKVVDVVMPNNDLCEKQIWMWAWIRGQGNLMSPPRKPNNDEIADMKAGGVYNNNVDIFTREEVTALLEKASREFDKRIAKAQEPIDPQQEVNPELAKAIDTLVEVSTDRFKSLEKRFEAIEERFDNLLADYRRRQSVVTRAAVNAAKEAVTAPSNVAKEKPQRKKGKG